MKAEAELKVGQARVRVQCDADAVLKVELLPLGSRAKKPAPPKGPLLKQAVAELKDYLQGRRKKFTVPFKQSGTPFHQSVWKALLTVPYGQVVSYGELARLAGRPRAARAVGTAMNRNQLPLIVPCHRVVASNGIGGYGCGIEWKKLLLEMEKGGA